MSKKTIGNLVAVVRLGVGLTSYVSPSVSSGGSSMGTDLDWRQRYLWRIFGSRDALLAIGVLTAKDDASWRKWVTASMVSDLCDLIASVPSGRQGEMSTAEQAVHSAPGFLGTIFGTLALLITRETTDAD